MSTLIQLSIQVHAALLRIYPTSFRMEFEEEMRAVFAEATAEAAEGGFRSVAALWLREAWDWPWSLLREFWFDWRRRRGTMMNGSRHPSQGTPTWTAIGLVILPGLFVFGSSWVVSAREPVPILGLALCGAVCLVGLIRTHHLPLWSYPTLGISLGLLMRSFWLLGPLLAPLAILAIVRWFQRQRVEVPRLAWALVFLMFVIGLARPVILSVFPNHDLYVNPWDLTVDGALLSVVALGLLLARRSGIMASLFVLACGFVLSEEVLDFTYGLWKTPWGIVMMAILASSLLIVAPLWMVRARTTRWRIVGILLPAAVALSCIVTINAVVRTQPSILDNILNLTAFVSATSPPWIGVGVLGAGELWPILIGGGLTATQLFLSLMLSTILYSQFRGKDALASKVPAKSKTSNISELVRTSEV
jgi:MFS family permease